MKENTLYSIYRMAFVLPCPPSPLQSRPFHHTSHQRLALDTRSATHSRHVSRVIALGFQNSSDLLILYCCGFFLVFLWNIRFVDHRSFFGRLPVTCCHCGRALGTSSQVRHRLVLIQGVDDLPQSNLNLVQCILAGGIRQQAVVDCTCDFSVCLSQTVL